MTTKDLAADFGGSLAAWNTFYQAQGAVTTLTVSATTFVADSALALYGPGANIIGAGSTQSTINNISQTFTENPYDAVNPNGIKPRIQKAFVNSNSITLSATNASSQFTVGKYVLVICYDMQGFGYPCNNQFFDFCKVTAISTSNGVLTLDRALRYDYLPTYPLLSPGDVTHVDQGGPGTAIALGSNWDADMLVQGLTIGSTQAFFGQVRNVTWQDVATTNWSPIPSFGETWTLNNCSLTRAQTVEADKFVKDVVIDNTFVGFMFCQSGSIDNMTIRNGSHFQVLQGTVKHTNIINSTIDSLSIGPTAYGWAKSLTVTNSVVGDCSNLESPSFPRLFNVTVMNRSGGTFSCSQSVASSNNILGDFVPGGLYFLGNANGVYVGPCFSITNVTYDGTNLTYYTTLTGLEPQFGTNIAINRIGAQDCLQVTVTGTAAGDALAGLDNPAAYGRPLYSYYNSGTVSNFASGYGVPPGLVFGPVVSITVNVTQAYTGTNNPLYLKLDQFFLPIINSSYRSDLTYDPHFDLRTVGKRVIYPGSTIGTTGGDFGLDIGNPTAIQSVYARSSFLSHNGVNSTDISGESSSVWPSFSFEIITSLETQVPFSYSVDSGLGSATKMVPG